MISDIQVEEQESSRVSKFRPPSDEEGLTLLDLLVLLARSKLLIAKGTVSAMLVATIVVFLIPAKYTAVTKILPPQQSQSSLSSMLGQLGALSSLAGGKDMLALKNPSDLYVGMLKSRSIADSVIKQFDLKHTYKDDNMADARMDLAKRVEIESGKDGLISVSFEDKDPSRAADIANAYVERLYEASQRLAISEASQRRLFYEKQLAAEKDALSAAEVQLKKMQERTGLIQLSSQADVIIRSSAMLKAQISSKEVQLQGLRSFSTEQNPALMRVEQELAALKSQMAKLEHDQKLGEGNIQIPTGQVPEVGLEYVRRAREVKYHEVLFEILAKQFEAAKIDEGKSAPVIQVVDVAVPPDKRSGPPRLLIIIASTLLACLLSCIYVLTHAAIQNMQSDPEQSAKLRILKKALR
jgi:tyrosine-protein kinase Etk/Wzc